jgi:hypothetical protein
MMPKNRFLQFIQGCIPCCCFTTQVVVTAAADIALDLANMDAHTPAVNDAIERVFTPMTITAINALDIVIQHQEEVVEVPRPTDYPLIRTTEEVVEQVTNTTIHLARDAANAAVAIYLEHKKATALTPIAQGVITRAAQAVETVTDFVIHTAANTTVTVAEYIGSPRSTFSPRPPAIPRPSTPPFPEDDSDSESQNSTFVTNTSDFVSLSGNSDEGLTDINGCNLI